MIDSCCRLTGSVELTFELPDSAKECFHEIIEKDVESTLEFQVATIYL
jgi:p24 family protein gamma-3